MMAFLIRQEMTGEKWVGGKGSRDVNVGRNYDNECCVAYVGV